MSPHSTPSADPTPPPALTYASLQARCTAILTSIRTVQTALAAPRYAAHGIRLHTRTFEALVRAELRALERQAKRDAGARDTHALRSTNVPFYEAVWGVACRCKAVWGLSRRVYWDGGHESRWRVVREGMVKEGKQKTEASNTVEKEEQEENEAETKEENASAQRAWVPRRKKNTEHPPSWNGSLLEENVASGGRARAAAHRAKLKSSAVVDIVAEHGLEWVKVSSTTETRLLFELARLGWDGDDRETWTLPERRKRGSAHGDGGSEDGRKVKALVEAGGVERSKSDVDEDSSDADSTASDELSEDDDDDEVAILRTAEDLVRAARASQNRVRHRNPRVRLELLRISRGQLPQIDALIALIEKIGVEVTTAESRLDEQPQPSNIEKSLSDEALGRMLADPYFNLTPTVNIDCTILLALVSDLSHESPAALLSSSATQSEFPSVNRHTTTLKQIDTEERMPLLPYVLYPALRGRKMVCTFEAFRRCQEIVDTIGTRTEKARFDILHYWDLFPNDEACTERGMGALLRASGQTSVEGFDASAGTSRNGGPLEFATAKTFDDGSLLDVWDGLSIHKTPPDLPLAIRLVEANSADASPLPRIASDIVQPQLSEINQSVFGYGWRSGHTTITSNRGVSNQIAKLIEDHRYCYEDVNGTKESVDGSKPERLRGPEIWLTTVARSLVGKENRRREGMPRVGNEPTNLKLREETDRQRLERWKQQRPWFAKPKALEPVVGTHAGSGGEL